MNNDIIDSCFAWRPPVDNHKAVELLRGCEAPRRTIWRTVRMVLPYNRLLHMGVGRGDGNDLRTVPSRIGSSFQPRDRSRNCHEQSEQAPDS